MWLSMFIWGPFYYIITGNDPLDIDFEFHVEYFTNWYFDKFGPKDD